MYRKIFNAIVSAESLFSAWEEFSKGKRARPDVQIFSDSLERNLLALHRDLASEAYRHGSYIPFTICDPKQRLIHKATVRDRIVHHAVFAALNLIFEPTFIAHSFSCRKGKGTHRGVDALEKMLRQVSRNSTRVCFALKCDIYRFFASVDHTTLLSMLGKRIDDERVMKLLREIVGSFHNTSGKGIPIGNLTSQLFANVYMNAFDQFIKHTLKVRHFIRYTDDFIVVSESEEYLLTLLPSIRFFLQSTLHLDLHPHKVSLKKYRQGIDFLGLLLLPHHRVLRTKTKRRILRKLDQKLGLVRGGICSAESFEQSLQSYLGVLSHADAFRLSQDIQNQYWTMH